jgi:hypothetical protein
MEIKRDTYIYKHDVQVGCVIWTKNIGFSFFEPALFPVDLVKNQEGPKHEMSPYFFQLKYINKPLFPLKKDEKEREKEEKGQHGIDEKQGPPEPFKWKKKNFDSLLKHLLLKQGCEVNKRSRGPQMKMIE